MVRCVWGGESFIAALILRKDKRRKHSGEGHGAHVCVCLYGPA